MTKPYSPPPPTYNNKQFVGSVSSSSNKLLEETDFSEIPEEVILYVHFARLWVLFVLLLRSHSSVQAWEQQQIKMICMMKLKRILVMLLTIHFRTFCAGYT
jgi:hypothetical protein